MLTLGDVRDEYPDMPAATLHHALNRLVEDGEVEHVAHGRYTLHDPRVGGPAAHEYSVATSLFGEAAIAGWSAMSQWGLTDQIPQVIDVAVPRDRHVRHHSPGRSRLRVFVVSRREWFDIVTVWVSDGEPVPFFSRERCIYDAFLVPKRYGGLGAAMDILTTARDDLGEPLIALVQTALKSRSPRTMLRFARALEEIYGPAPEIDELRAVAKGQAVVDWDGSESHPSDDDHTT